MTTKASSAFELTQCDKGHVHRYDRIYDKIFDKFTPRSLLEVGINEGRSLAAWRLMFPHCDISAIDIVTKNFNEKLIKFSNATIVIADSTKPAILTKLYDSYDIIIDDGSHYYRDIMRTFQNLHTKFSKYYIIEDYYYDLDLAKQYINSFGFQNVQVFKSKNSNIEIQDRYIFKHPTTTKSRKIDQNFIVIRR